MWIAAPWSGAGDNVVVQAEDDTTQTQVAGSLGVGGVGVGVAAAIGVLTKDTESWVASSAFGHGQCGTPPASPPIRGRQPHQQQRPAIHAKDGVRSATPRSGPAARSAPANHGFSTGQAVIYSSGNLPLAGLREGQRLLRDRRQREQLPPGRRALRTPRRASRSTPCASTAPARDVNQVELFTDAGVPDASSSAFNGAGLLTNPFGAAATAVQRGVVVVAVSTNNLQNAGGAGSGGGVAVSVAGTVGGG